MRARPRRPARMLSSARSCGARAYAASARCGNDCIFSANAARFTGAWVRSTSRTWSRSTPAGVRAVDDVSLTIGEGEFIVLVGPVGLRQDDAAPLRSAASRSVTGGRILIGERDVTKLAAGRPRPRDGLPELRALPAHDRAEEPRLRAARPQDPEGGDRRAASPRRRSCSGSTSCSTGGRGSSRAGSSSASRWAARSCASRRRS